MKADIIINGGRIITLEQGKREAQAIAIGQGRILGIGSTGEIKPFLGPATEVVDAAGASVVPGLRDSHLHLLGYGLKLRQIDLCGVESISAIKKKISRYIEDRRLPPGCWVIGRGWDQNVLAEKRYPCAADFADFFPEYPLYLVRFCGHMGTLNQTGLSTLGFGAATPNPAGGEIEKNDRGELTGLLFGETALGLVRNALPPLPEQELEQVFKEALAKAVATGLVEVHSDDLGYSGGFSRAVKAYTALAGRGELPVRIRMELLANSPDELVALIAAVKAWRQETDQVEPATIKLVADGSLGARTAGLSQPYADAAETRGHLYHSSEELARMVMLAHREGFQTAIHAIGDRAATVALDAIENARARCDGGRIRHRLVHCQIMNPALWQQMRRLEVIADIQPRFLASDWSIVGERLGEQRAKVSYAWKSMRENGIMLAGGSDCPIEPLDPLLGIHSAINRTDLDGRPAGGWYPAERLTALEALELFTKGVAYAAQAEASRGGIKQGNWADITIIEGDYLRETEAVCRNNRIRTVISSGRVSYMKK